MYGVCCLTMIIKCLGVVVDPRHTMDYIQNIISILKSVWDTKVFQIRFQTC